MIFIYLLCFKFIYINLKVILYYNIMGYSKSPRRIKAPSYLAEFSFVSINVLFLKLYSVESYNATGFFTVMLPLMIYSVITLFGNLLKFIQMMYIEDEEESGRILTKKQTKLLIKVIKCLMSYFGIYFLSA